jgi:hypothetical protein
MNDLGAFAGVFDGLSPYNGPVPPGFLVNFLGGLTDAKFRTIWGVDPAQEGGGRAETRLPVVEDGEGWFEAVNCIESVREANGQYVMMTLGACYGGQAVDSYKAVQAINPMPVKLVAVEGDHENVAWTRKNFTDNGIGEDEYWLLEAAMAASNEPVIFPVGSPGSGAQNCISTNDAGARQRMAAHIASANLSETVMRNMLLGNSTGIQIELAPNTEYDFKAELRYVSAVTLCDVLAPFDRVDYVEADLQQSEVVVFPPAMEMLTRKARRVHLGTHGADAHRDMHDLFVRHGWDILFSFAGNQDYETPQGSFHLNDGVLSAVNPAATCG